MCMHIAVPLCHWRIHMRPLKMYKWKCGSGLSGIIGSKLQAVTNVSISGAFSKPTSHQMQSTNSLLYPCRLSDNACAPINYLGLYMHTLRRICSYCMSVNTTSNKDTMPIPKAQSTLYTFKGLIRPTSKHFLLKKTNVFIER